MSLHSDCAGDRVQVFVLPTSRWVSSGATVWGLRVWLQLGRAAEIYDDNRVYLTVCLSWPVASKRLTDKNHTLITECTEQREIGSNFKV